MENISCIKFLSDFNLHAGKLISIEKYLQASNTFVLFICSRYYTCFSFISDILYNFVCVNWI